MARPRRRPRAPHLRLLAQERLGGGHLLLLRAQHLAPSPLAERRRRAQELDGVVRRPLLEDRPVQIAGALVEREALLAFVQMRTQEANAEGLAATFDGLSTEARQIWIDRFVREEALVREARRLGLDRQDELIRRRLVQKMEFLAEGIVASDFLLGEDEISEIAMRIATKS